MSDARVSDAQARAAAIDPSRSFIVQAPAGSGKTELLIQRYLVLLATVEEPEQVVAITFTRKAAAEMRRRVLQALRSTRAAAAPERPHEAATHALALAVAARDRERDWSLQAAPQRLRIDTLDALNAGLAQQLPILAGGVAAAEIVEDASAFYRAAARQTVRQLADDGLVGEGIRTLIRTLDGSVAKLETLLAELLPKRDQWLAHLAGRDPARLRAALEAALGRLVDDQLAALAAAWPPRVLDALAATLGDAVAGDDPALLAGLDAWRAAVPPSGAAALHAWKAAAAVLLTRDGAWRKQTPKPYGFGADRPLARDRLKRLLELLGTEHDELRAPLAATQRLPEPCYSEPQWRNLAALQTVLVRLAAELKVTFAQQRCVDFVELALAAQQALGSVEAPSELLLALDRRIQHLLVDEFQDTSQSQLRLLELLTAGWQHGDGRTIFLVGDPMQSIYRFRDADMSLFLKAKQRGIGTIALDSVSLTRNFRSAPAVVDWVNGVFARVFPDTDDIASGVAGFAPCAAVRAATADELVRLHALRSDSETAEVDRVIEILAEERTRAPQQSIAILVQSRKHLSGLHERLHAHGMHAHAVDIDALADQQIAQDVIGLARALLHDGDRIAWLGALRAPWCGVTWADLALLCEGARGRTVAQLLAEPARLARLSEDGRSRAAVLHAALERARATRGDAPLSRWIERTWLALGGPAAADDPAELRAAQQAFALLDRHERRGDVTDPARLHELLEAAQPAADPPRESGIEIMTMHRAKGLEFDTVILLGLGRETRGEDARALHWLERVAADGTEDLILAPLQAEGSEDALVDFVRGAERARDQSERARLLYVASTRARERLHLVAQLGTTRERPRPGTLLAHLWPLVGEEFGAAEESAVANVAEPPLALRPALRRFAALTPVPAAAEPAAAPQAFAVPLPAAQRPEFEWARQAAVHVGTVVHRALQRIAESGVDRYDAAAVRRHAAIFRHELQMLGVEPRELDGATARVLSALERVLDDSDGRWVLAAHPEARSELRLTLPAGAGFEHIRLDRTFVAEGRRWIVDFKTSQHQGGDLAAFLAAEEERYRAQLDRYARALAAIDARPIVVALYFPLLQVLRSWQPRA